VLFEALQGVTGQKTPIVRLDECAGISLLGRQRDAGEQIPVESPSLWDVGKRDTPFRSGLSRLETHCDLDIDTIGAAQAKSFPPDPQVIPISDDAGTSQVAVEQASSALCVTELGGPEQIVLPKDPEVPGHHSRQPDPELGSQEAHAQLTDASIAEIAPLIDDQTLGTAQSGRGHEG